MHGRHSRHPREWWFAKRILDRRPAIPLAYRGTSRFHPTAVANIAALVRVTAEQPGSRILNIANPDTPSVVEIARLMTGHFGYEGRVVEVDDDGFPPAIGRSPWSVPRPFLLDCAAALRLGYVPATRYSDAVGATCDCLVADAMDTDWPRRYPVLASYTRNLFDYGAEDAFFDAFSCD